MKPRILLFASTTGYQIREFGDAARRLEIDLVVASDRCHVLDDPWGDRAVAVRFDDPIAALEDLAARGPFDGVIAVGDRPAYVAAQVAEALAIPFSPPDAVHAAHNKFLARERFRQVGLPTPSYRLLPLDSDVMAEARSTRYPSVLKPIGLSGSRGVIRADDEHEFGAAFARIRTMVEHESESSIQIEDFIPGREFALEGLVTNGRLQVLALFDKPDPLDGPFFEETIYLTPSREPDSVRQSIGDATQQAVNGLGLTRGPVHCEMRVNRDGVWMLEVAARPIGGLCSRILRFDGYTFEEVLLKHASGDDVSKIHLAEGAHGVMMIPIPGAGIFSGVEGIEDALSVHGVEDVVITAKPGQPLIPLPEGASYLGFIFARGISAGMVDRALRDAHSCLRVLKLVVLPVVR